MPDNQPSGEDVRELLACDFCGQQPIRNGRLGTGGVVCFYAPPDRPHLAHRIQVYGATQAEADEAWNARHSALSTVNVDALREAGELFFQRVVASQTAGIPVRDDWTKEFRAALSTKAPLSMEGLEG